MKLPADMTKLRSRSLYLASPIYGNMLHFGFHQSICHLIQLCMAKGIHYHQKFVGCDSLVPRARNRLALFFLDSHDTDLLFVDSDIAFDPADALSLLARDEPIIGGVYPRKQLDWDRIARAARAGVAPDQLARYGVVPVVNWLPGEFRLDDLIEVRQLPTGFLRIRREVLETMIAKLGDSISFDHATEEGVFAGRPGYEFFPCGPDTRYPPGSGGRQYLSEDWAFSEVARALGYKLYAAPWIKLVHSGYYDYTGDLTILDESNLSPMPDDGLLIMEDGD